MRLPRKNSAGSYELLRLPRGISRPEDQPYLGALIGACLLQRGANIRKTATDLAKQAAVMMIQNLESYSNRRDAAALAEERLNLTNKREKVDPMILHRLFDDVHVGKFSSVRKSKEAMKLTHTDAALASASCLCLIIMFLLVID